MTGSTHRSKTSVRPLFAPGLVWAATSIGVTHLVQTTRAGALGWFALVCVIALALIV